MERDTGNHERIEGLPQDAVVEEHLLSTDLFMMAHRVSAEQPKPDAFREPTLARWGIRVMRVVQGRVVALTTNVSLPSFYFLVVMWLTRQRDAQGLYHSLSDVGVAFAAVYCNMFLMLNRAEIFARVREAAVIARDIEDLQTLSEARAEDVHQTRRLIQIIFAVCTGHPYAMFTLFLVPTLLNGESPSPLLERETLPLHFRYVFYIFQVFSVAVGETCLMLIEYVHLGTTLSASLMYRMLADRFASGTPILAAQLRRLASLHQRLVDNTQALQDLLSVTVLLTMGSAVIGLVASTLSLLGSESTDAYLYLTMPSTVFYIAVKCAVGDQLLSWSSSLAPSVYGCPWPEGDKAFRATVALVIVRAQRPQVMQARYVGQLDLPTARNIFNRWYTFVQYLQNTFE